MERRTVTRPQPPAPNRWASSPLPVSWVADGSRALAGLFCCRRPGLLDRVARARACLAGLGEG